MGSKTGKNIGKAAASFMRGAATKQSNPPGVQKSMATGPRFGSLRPGVTSTMAGGAFSDSTTAFPGGRLRYNSSASVSQLVTGGATSKRVSSYYHSSPLQTLTRCSLYLFGEKSAQNRQSKTTDCEFVPVQFPTAHDAKAALKKLLRLTAPSTLPTSSVGDDGSNAHLLALDDSHWMHMISSLLQYATAAVDLIDIQSSSVALCLEDGWDATAQLVSLIELMLDPHYRTFFGFKTLIEKEWLAFAHRFSYRSNHTLLASNSGFGPVFVAFLDAVHQIAVQFPSAFEFSDYYLKFIAYHSVAAYYQTLVLDSEAERAAMRIFYDGQTLMGESSSHELGFLSMWQAIADRNAKGTLFYNVRYRSDAYQVLRPQFSIAALELWSYYTEDTLAYAAPYDLDCAENEMHERESNQANVQDLIGIGRSTRRLVDVSLESTELKQKTGGQTLLEEIERLDRDLQHECRQWKTVLIECERRRADRRRQSSDDDLETSAIGASLQDDRASLASDDGFGEEEGEQQWEQWMSRAFHKKNTVEVLLRGRNSTSSAAQRPQSAAIGGSGGGVEHSFVQYHFSAPETCNVCAKVLWGAVARQGLRCKNCTYSVHEQCAVDATISCSGPPVSSGDVTVEKSAHEPTTPMVSVAEVASPVEKDNQQYFHKVRPEQRSHEGYLQKKGARFKAWKLRWFVLDTNMHQLRYYDSMQDSQCRGVIDLAEVQWCQLVIITSRSGAQPPPDSGCYFDLKTAKRPYNFFAQNRQVAEEWIEKINACLQ